jgi:hypothetical protein
MSGRSPRRREVVKTGAAPKRRRRARAKAATLDELGSPRRGRTERPDAPSSLRPRGGRRRGDVRPGDLGGHRRRPPAGKCPEKSTKVRWTRWGHSRRPRDQEKSRYTSEDLARTNLASTDEAALSHSAVVTNEKRCREARVSSLKQLSNKYRLRHVVCEAARSNKAAKTKTKMATVLPLFRPKHK